jgi:UDP-N-acetylglucosamine acyltransferase
MSGFAGAHQFSKLGDHCFLGMRCTVNQDVAPYMLVAGAEPSVRGLNLIGLKRRGFSEDTLKALRNSYKILFRQNMKLKDACSLILQEYDYPEVKLLVDFINQSERGLLR